MIKFISTLIHQRQDSTNLHKTSARSLVWHGTGTWHNTPSGDGHCDVSYHRSPEHNGNEPSASESPCDSEHPDPSDHSHHGTYDQDKEGAEFLNGYSQDTDTTTILVFSYDGNDYGAAYRSQRETMLAARQRQWRRRQFLDMLQSGIMLFIGFLLVDLILLVLGAPTNPMFSLFVIVLVLLVCSLFLLVITCCVYPW